MKIKYKVKDIEITSFSFTDDPPVELEPSHYVKFDKYRFCPCVYVAFVDGWTDKDQLGLILFRESVDTHLKLKWHYSTHISEVVTTVVFPVFPI